jgi:dUTP pyrophosphatase
MNQIVETMRQKLMEVVDPNNPYTQEDFDREFSKTPVTIDPDFHKIKIQLVNKSTNEDPQYATEGSSGFDLRANLPETNMVISVGKRAVVPTGLYFETPKNFEIQVRPRSGLAAKNGVTVLNTPGTVDADYRGEVKVILINLGEEDFVINHGDRIAQAVVSPVTAKNMIKLTKVSEISTDTERGVGGFGSTGKN